MELWCSGYRLLNTQKVSSSNLDSIKAKFRQNDVFYLIKIKIKHLISGQSNIWYAITASKYQSQVVPKFTSGEHAEKLKFKPGEHQRKVLTVGFTWLKLKTYNWFLVNPASDMKTMLRSTNRELAFCNGYHVCITRGMFLVQAWTASRKNFDKIMPLLD